MGGKDVAGYIIFTIAIYLMRHFEQKEAVRDDHGEDDTVLE